MSRKSKMINSIIFIALGIGLLLFVLRNFKNYTSWWLNKIGLWFQTENLFIKYLMANLFDVVVVIIIIAVVIFIITAINKFKRR
jgi:hypothetical protein